MDVEQHNTAIVQVHETGTSYGIEIVTEIWIVVGIPRSGSGPGQTSISYKYSVHALF